MSPEPVPQDLIKDLSDSEKRLKGFYGKRDYFNEEAKVIREMRDDLHDKRRTIFDQISDIRDKKGEIIEDMKRAKARRDGYNERARALRGGPGRGQEGKKENLYEDIHTIEVELRKLEERYQTQPAKNLEAERTLVNSIESQRKKLKDLRAKEPEFRVEEIKETSLEEEADDFRRLADEEHAKVQELYKSLKEVEKRLDEYYPTLKHLKSEADKRHEEYLKIRKQADSYHAKAMEIREKVLQMRSERDKIRREAREIIDEQNKQVKKALDNMDSLDEAAEEAMGLLIKKGRISL